MIQMGGGDIRETTSQLKARHSRQFEKKTQNKTLSKVIKS